MKSQDSASATSQQGVHKVSSPSWGARAFHPPFPFLNIFQKLPATSKTIIPRQELLQTPSLQPCVPCPEGYPGVKALLGRPSVLSACLLID